MKQPTGKIYNRLKQTNGEYTST